MPIDEVLIEWTKTDSGATEGVADVTVFTDGRVRLGRRLADGEPLWDQLPDEELQELRRLVFDELRLLEIDGEALSRLVAAAAAERKSKTANLAFEIVTSPQMDAQDTLLKVADKERATEIRLYDLFGKAESYPEVESLQRLRRIELRLIEIAEALGQRHP